MSEAAKSRAVSLIGMMGAGKTTVGLELARELGWHYHDNDSEIEAKSGKTVAQMFHDDGETTFRDWEQRVCEDALKSDKQSIVSVGGGAVLREATRDALKQDSWVVWLRAPIEVLIDRVIDRRIERPMIEDDPEASMRNLYKQRQPIYEALADQIVDDNQRTPQEVAAEIIKELHNP